MADEKVEPTPAEKLAAEFAHPDSGFDAELDTPRQPKSKQENQAVSPEAPAAPPQAAGAPLHKHSAYMVQKAMHFGLSQSDIDNTPPEDLREWVRDLQASLASRTSSAQVPPQSPAVTQSPAPAEENHWEEIEKNYDESTVKLLKSIRDEVAREAKKENEQLRQHLQTIQQREQQRELQSVYERFDAFFAKHPEIYGKGAGTDLDRSGTEFQRRLMMISQVQNSGDMRAIEANCEKAHAIIYGAKKEEPASVRNGELERWNRGGLARPTSRESPSEPKGERRATKAVAKMMRDMGDDWLEETGTEENGLPE